MLKVGKPPKENRLTPRDTVALDKIQLLPNEVRAAASITPGDLSEQQWYDASRHVLDLTSQSNNISARKTFAWAIFGMVSVWLAAVLLVTVLTGLRVFVLDKAVLIALIVSGSANVISLFSLVAKYLFHVHEVQGPIIETKIETAGKAEPKDDVPPAEENEEEDK